MIDTATFECSKCGKTFPVYVDGKLNLASAGNIGGYLQWEICFGCYGNPSIDEIVESLRMFITAPKELEANE